MKDKSASGGDEPAAAAPATTAGNIDPDKIDDYQGYGAQVPAASARRRNHNLRHSKSNQSEDSVDDVTMNPCKYPCGFHTNCIDFILTLPSLHDHQQPIGFTLFWVKTIRIWFRCTLCSVSWKSCMSAEAPLNGVKLLGKT